MHHLEKELGSEENVGKSEPHEGGESGHESAAQVEVLAVGGHEGGAGEAGEDAGGDHEGGGDQGGVHHHGELQQRTHAQTCKLGIFG